MIAVSVPSKSVPMYYRNEPMNGTEIGFPTNHSNRDITGLKQHHSQQLSVYKLKQFKFVTEKE